MRIGVLTYFKVANFGANLQAVSTYLFLKKKGHEPYFINYLSKENYDIFFKEDKNTQSASHFKFVNTIINEQSHFCFNIDDVLDELRRLGIQAVIIGSDAVLQHHPFIKRFHKGRRKPIWFAHITQERLFPSPFWAVGIVEKYPVAYMSASSQNSEYMFFNPLTKARMNKVLSKVKYLSVRDTWTFDMIKSINDQLYVEITPDPVFAFNENAYELIGSRSQIINKYHLPEKYIIFSFFEQVFSLEYLRKLKSLFIDEGYECVAMPMPTGMRFKHCFNYEIPLPLDPIDWYCLLKYSSGYIGSNMHPIVVCLHNAVPCVSIDNWGRTNFFGKKMDDGSSKVEHILSVFGLSNNRHPINKGKCDVDPDVIIESILNFPSVKVSEKSKELYDKYNTMMSKILYSIK